MSEYTPKQWIINNLFTSKKLKKLGEIVANILTKTDALPKVNTSSKIKYLTTQNGEITAGANETEMYALADLGGGQYILLDMDFNGVTFDSLYSAIINNKYININTYDGSNTSVAGKAIVCGSTAYADSYQQSEPDTRKAITIFANEIVTKNGAKVAQLRTFYTDESMINESGEAVFMEIDDESGSAEYPLNVINITSTWDSSVLDDSGYKITATPNFATLKTVAMNGKPIIVNEYFSGGLFTGYFAGIGYVYLHNSDYTEFYIEYTNPANRFSVRLACENNSVTPQVSNLGGFLPRHDSTMAGRSLKVMSDGSIAWSN